MAELALELAEAIPEIRAGVLIGEMVAGAIDPLRGRYPDENVNTSQQRIDDQMFAALQPAKSFAELQTQPEDHLLGYELHHIVEQNPSNLAKGDFISAEDLTKFGQAALDDPTNLGWISRLKHEDITAYYNGSADGDPAGRRVRQVVSAGDFDAQREAGLMALRKFGVLK